MEEHWGCSSHLKHQGDCISLWLWLRKVVKNICAASTLPAAKLQCILVVLDWLCLKAELPMNSALKDLAIQIKRISLLLHHHRHTTPLLPSFFVLPSSPLFRWALAMLLSTLCGIVTWWIVLGSPLPFLLFCFDGLRTWWPSGPW